MSTVVNRKRKLLSRLGKREKKMLALRSAVARMQPVRRAAEVVPEKTFVVAKVLDYEVRLVHVRRGTPPHYRSNCVADILCLNLEEFSLPEAVAWVQAAVEDAHGVRPGIAILGSVDKLSREELWQISRELEPAGAIFHGWPKNCHSFDEAFEILGKEIRKTYGNPIVHGAGALTATSHYGIAR
ncbi:MAG: hypothetical protein WCF57_05360 [Pyrinomonadaceae bacterium]